MTTNDTEMGRMFTAADIDRWQQNSKTYGNLGMRKVTVIVITYTVYFTLDLIYER